jgi:hypothetical protein
MIRKTRFSPRFKLGALLLGLVLPLQTLTHCGILLAAVKAHDHHPVSESLVAGAAFHGHGPHATTTDESLGRGRALQAKGSARLPGSGVPLLSSAHEGCVVADLVFTVKRLSTWDTTAQTSFLSPLPHSAALPLVSPVAEAGAPTAVLSSPASLTLPLRI